MDTSAQIERLCGRAKSRDTLKTLLGGGGHATSTQVRREWNSILLGACSRLLNALPRAVDADDVSAIMNHGFGREPSHNWMVTRLLLGGDTDLRAAEMRARRFIRFGADAAFEEGVTTIRNGTDCGVAKREATQDIKTGEWSHDMMCRKDQDICSQQAFLIEQLERAQTVAKALEASPSDRSGDKKMGQKASKILAKTPTRDSKGKACWGGGGIGGDICIALECAPDETLVATDRSFDVICPALGIEHRRVA